MNKKKLIVVGLVLCSFVSFIFLYTIGAFEYVEDASLEQNFTSDSTISAEERKTYFNQNNNLYFGDLHIHTSYSSDAYLMGVRTLPEDAYNFAKGKVIEHGAGYPIQISKPLDFAAVTDHSEYLGMMRVSDPEVPLETQSLKDILQQKNKLAITLDYLKTTLRIAKHYFKPFVINEEASKTAWQEMIDVAEEHYQPSIFTTFIAYEWSSQPNGDNLHRNVIYRGDRTQVAKRPFSALDSIDPEDFLTELKRQNEQGMRVLAIPHNGNLSNGRMYGKKDFSGNKMSESYAELRANYEPLSEILQVKGASETHPILSNLDEFADFEIFESNMSAFGEVAPPNGSYTRDALRAGMEMSHDEGFNPYKFGVIGASDGHNSSSPVEEDKYHGKLPMMDGAASLRMNKALLLPDSQNRAIRWGSGGLAGVWAKENTREALFDAMMSKETFATSGPRILVRFFSSWGFGKLVENSPDKSSPDVISAAYQSGVAMGSDMKTKAPEAGAPQFLIWAAKDPDGAMLDRIQLVKLWLDEKGKAHEKVFNLAASGGRVVDDAGDFPSVGNTVDVEDASYQNTIGAERLQVFWQDPEFSELVEASYYVRVLEIPTPRWSTYDAKTLGVEPIEPSVIQERAISSAIWYKP